MPSNIRNRSPSPHSRRAATSRDDYDRRDERPRSYSPRRQVSGSHSPAKAHHYRSRSPRPYSPPAAEEARPRKKIAGGFKFKEKSKGDAHEEKDRGEGGRGLERGYRERDTERRPPPSTRDDDRITEKFGAGASVKDKFGDTGIAGGLGNDTAGDNPAEEGRKEKKRKEKRKAPVAQPTTEMIIVRVNDRLGTASSIMCSPSDTIKDFKKFVAQQIGRQPHEIMVKRQGERPFKDQLTLEDYGVSNGVQLDLELDTGD